MYHMGYFSIVSCRGKINLQPGDVRPIKQNRKILQGVWRGECVRHLERMLTTFRRRFVPMYNDLLKHNFSVKFTAYYVIHIIIVGQNNSFQYEWWNLLCRFYHRIFGKIKCNYPDYLFQSTF